MQVIYATRSGDDIEGFGGRNYNINRVGVVVSTAATLLCTYGDNLKRRPS